MTADAAKLETKDFVIQPKTGLDADKRTNATKRLLHIAELLYCTDTKQLYISDKTADGGSLPNVLQIAVLPAESDAGATGSFVDNGGNTVTVKNGLITLLS